MNTKKLLDIKKVIESRTYVTSLKDLEKKGKTKLKVVKADEIYDLITTAVENVILQHSIDIAKEEKAKLIEKSKKEFQGLLAERQEEKKRAALQEKLIGNYEQKLAQSQNEILQIRQKAQEDGEQFKREREKSQNLERTLTQLQERIKTLEKENLDLQQALKRNEEKDTYISQMEELKELVKNRGMEDRLLQEQQRIQSAYEDQIAALKDELKNVRQSMNYSESFTSLLSEVKLLKSTLNELEKDRAARIDEKFFQKQLTPLLDKEEKINSRMEKLFAEKMEKLSQKISQKIVGLSVMGGKIVDEKDSEEAAKIVLDNLFKEDFSLESNLENIGVKERTGGGILGNLEKLKALRMDSISKEKKEKEEEDKQEEKG